MAAVDADGIGAAALAFRLADVDPMLVAALFEEGDVLLAERSKPLQDELERLLIGKAQLGVFDEGRIDVVHVHLVVAQDTLTDMHIAVHERRCVVDRLDEVAVDALVDVFAHERLLKAALISADVFIEDVLLDAAVIGRCERPQNFSVSGIEETERFFALCAVLPAHDHGIQPVRDRLLLAFVLDLGRVELGVVEHAEHVVGNGHGLRRLREDALLRFGEDILLLGKNAGEHIVVVFEAFVRGEGSERLFGEGGEFGRHEGRFHRIFGHEPHHLAHVTHVLGVADVLVVLQKGIEIDAHHFDRERFFLFEIGNEVFCGVEGAAVFCKADLGSERVEGDLPSLIGREDVFHRPLVFLFYFRSFHKIPPKMVSKPMPCKFNS